MAANTEMSRLDSIPSETLAKLISGADNQLPKVTSSDNDKVLVVKNGKWSKGEATGGGGVLVVHIDGEALDKTWQEIHDADFAVVTYDLNDLNGNQKVWDIVTITYDTSEDYYSVTTFASGTFEANSANGYPIRESGGDGGDTPPVV